MNLGEELEAIGCKLDAATFTERLVKLFVKKFKEYTVEDVLCNPSRDAVPFCEMVAGKLRIPPGPEAEQLICRTLLNQRKKGELSIHGRVATEV